MPYQSIQFEMGPDSLIELGEAMTRRWQETVADAQDTLAKSLESRNPMDAWSLQLAFGMRNAQRWFGTAGFGPAEPAAPTADKAPVEPGLPSANGHGSAEVNAAAQTVETEAAVGEIAGDIVGEPHPQAVAFEDADEAVDAASAKDSLEKIRGIGPAIARKLAARGIVDFVQLAALDRAAIADLDSALDLKGRIDRDDWVGQARMLANKP